MKQQTILLGLTATLPAVLAWTNPDAEPIANRLAARQSGSNGDGDDIPYEDVVCKPSTSPDEPVAPCVSIELIETACRPNGTSPLHYEAHGQCMCGGSFFAEKLACERCLQVHGLRSERGFAHYSAVLEAASEALCTGTPTAPFASIFSAFVAEASVPTTGATATSDQAEGETAVSLYYTHSGEQGPGEITGSATGATAEETSSSETETETDTTTLPTTRETNTAGADSSETGSDSSDNAAQPTAAVGVMAMGMAGVAMMAAM